VKTRIWFLDERNGKQVLRSTTARLQEGIAFVNLRENRGGTTFMKPGDFFVGTRSQALKRAREGLTRAAIELRAQADRTEKLAAELR
jgi:hypothetical protein